MSIRSESVMSTNVPSFAVPKSRTVTAEKSSPTRTPSARSPAKKASKGISLAQKQAILDNLQQESESRLRIPKAGFTYPSLVTVRARRLRAQYGTQAEGLRTRVEFRVNRIPPALRKQKLGDLIEKYNDEGTKPSGSQSAACIKNPLKESQGNSRTNTDSPENSRKNKKRSR